MAQNDFHVRWDILVDPWYNNNLPERHDFNLQDPILTTWHIEFISIEQDYYIIRKYYCRLNFHPNHSLSRVTAERVEIVVLLNNVQVSENRIEEYPFCSETRFLLDCHIEADGYDDRNRNIFSILMRIDLKREGIEVARALRNQQEPLLIGGDDVDMLFLYLDMERCLMRRIFPTMKILSRENNEHFVHHCILQARWTNLFKIHNLNANSDSVKINISDRVLKCILLYMYNTYIFWDDEILTEQESVDELFEVIFKYEIFHLYGALCQLIGNLVVQTMPNTDKRRIPIVLRFVGNIRLKRHSFSFPIYSHPFCFVDSETVLVHTFLFTVHVKHIDSVGPWLYFSVLSLTNIRFNVHVTLELDGRDKKPIYIHSEVYTVPGNARIESPLILFLGCPETFGGHSSQLQDNEIWEKLLFGLTFNYDDEHINIWYQSIPNEITKCIADVYSQHMLTMLRREFKSDLEVQVNSPGNVESSVVLHIHKAIFATRIPRWWNVVEPNLSEGASLPDRVRIRLSSESFHLVCLYMYTGKIFQIPAALCPEIRSFALKGRLQVLNSYATPNNRGPWKNAAEFFDL